MPNLENVNNAIVIGEAVIPLAETAVRSIIEAIRGGSASVSIDVSLPSAEAEFKRLVDVADEWDRTHPKP